MTKKDYTRARALMQSHADLSVRALLTVLVLEIDGKTFALRAAEQVIATKDELIAGMGEKMKTMSEHLSRIAEKGK